MTAGMFEGVALLTEIERLATVGAVQLGPPG
jgi:hypothetical protein